MSWHRPLLLLISYIHYYVLIYFVLYQCSINCSSSYSRMYKDVRAAVDLCHRDGTLKQMVAKDPKR